MFFWLETTNLPCSAALGVPHIAPLFLGVELKKGASGPELLFVDWVRPDNFPEKLRVPFSVNIEGHISNGFYGCFQVRNAAMSTVDCVVQDGCYRHSSKDLIQHFKKNVPLSRILAKTFLKEGILSLNISAFVTILIDCFK